MNKRRELAPIMPTLAAAIVLPLSCLLLTSGCAGNKQYRTALRVCADTNSPDCPKAVLERTPNYLLGFVEFDDQGWLWSRKQMDKVLEEVRNEMGPGQKQGVLLLTFIHGWKNNAAYDNGNVQEFRRTLEQVAQLEAEQAESYKVAPRKVVGVYVGWRGLTLTSWMLKQTTFWARKRTGHEVGRGALSELLLRLEALVEQSKAAVKAAGHSESAKWEVASRLIIVGHSFGAAATYSALAPVYLERILEPHDADGDGVVTRGFGDLVVLVNPAFEAARFQFLRDAAMNPRPDGSEDRRLLNLAILTSKGDTATKNLFPIGRFFSALFQSHRDSDQYQANISAVGHYRKYITHDLLYRRKPKSEPTGMMEQSTRKEAPYQRDPVQSQQILKDRRTEFASVERLQKALGEEMVFSSSELKSRPGRKASSSPFIVAQVDKKLVPDHNDIWHPAFTTFLGEFMQLFAEDERGKKAR